MCRILVLACLVLAPCLACGGAFAQEAQSQGDMDRAVTEAIDRAAQNLWSQQRADGSWPPHSGTRYPMGPTALATYALLESGVSPQDERMAKAIKWLADFGVDANRTYSVALRCQVWLIVNRKMQNKYLKHFEADVTRLIKSTREGAYNYYVNADACSHGDHSNSQFGVLGVWAGARANLECIPQGYWYTVMKHWLNTQCLDGGWQYQPVAVAESKASMTAAGVATMFVCFDNLFHDAFIKCNVADRVQFKSIQRGLDWLDRNFDQTIAGAACYYLYAMERVGLASGYKYFGKADWYKLGTQELLRRQRGGDWGGLPDTCFAMLFLTRGRNPVLFNKLQYSGDWNNRPRALASLTRWISRNFEKTVNWQIINLKVPVSEWHDAPIIYLSGAKKPEFSDEEIAKLRRYVWQGGTIFSVTECGGKDFKTGIREVYAKAFPDYEMVPVRPDHELYGLHFKLRGRPRFHMIHNGIRPLVIHTDDDLALSWQTLRHVTQPWAYEGAANVFFYVTDKGSLRARGVRHWPEESQEAVGRRVKLARLKYTGHWNPEPLAYERFGRLLGREGVSLEVLDAVELKDLASSGAQLATLTGTGALRLSVEDKALLKKYVDGGGVLVLDAAGGDRKFGASAEQMVLELFGRDSLQRLGPTAKLYNVSGKEIREFKYRRRTRSRLGRDRAPWLKSVLRGDRAVLYLSREDLTGGMVGYASYECDGYEPETAYQIMRNIVLSTPPAAAAAP
ncbi:MAG TPA: DUF4159 domain-containing protein [Phycisphaerae bacterium]|nr:DUF4159 domain-containing protein [Phycisphaerae bacterium]